MTSSLSFVSLSWSRSQINWQILLEFEFSSSLLL